MKIINCTRKIQNYFSEDFFKKKEPENEYENMGMKDMQMKYGNNE